MAGGCVLCPGDSLDICPGGTFTTPKGMTSGACAAVDGNCVGGETAVPTTIVNIPAPAHTPSSGTSTKSAGEIHQTTSSSSTFRSTQTTTSTHSSTVTYKTTSTLKSTVVQKSEPTVMSPKDAAALSFLDTAVDLEK
ncbi:hypothetical protein B0A48_12920 [Cryoendolithus antarcticus]|uniref:Uncharacterized protein n=1 Tax=Cryoendolithus antarcticus TaxID=1507870 RepID=A0A1V8SQB1_9PEZI|nr:hypothetical protein B0A48_12920 [Cryoendolithus antarcticus]